MSTAAKVELFISKRPYLREALAQDVVNYSALARKISEEQGIESQSAAKAAVSRYQEAVSRQNSERRERVVRILEATSVSVRSNVEVVLEQVEDPIVSSCTANGYTSVVSGEGKALVSLESPSGLEKTPGVLEFILSSIAAEGINIDHFISCREDTHLIVDSDDAPEVLELLQERVG